MIPGKGQHAAPPVAQILADFFTRGTICSSAANSLKFLMDVSFRHFLQPETLQTSSEEKQPVRNGSFLVHVIVAASPVAQNLSDCQEESQPVQNDGFFAQNIVQEILSFGQVPH